MVKGSRVLTVWTRSNVVNLLSGRGIRAASDFSFSEVTLNKGACLSTFVFVGACSVEGTPWTQNSCSSGRVH